MKGANVCFFEENAPLPESAAGASDHNVKRAKKCNKVMEIQVLWEKLCIFWMLMNKGQAKLLVCLSHE